MSRIKMIIQVLLHSPLDVELACLQKYQISSIKLSTLACFGIQRLVIYCAHILALSRLKLFS